MYRTVTFRATALTALMMIIVSPEESGAQTNTYRITNAVGPAACLTEDAYQQYGNAALYARETRDVSRMKWMYDSGQCFRMKKGARAELVDYGFTTSQIRIRLANGKSVLAWTANENLHRLAQASSRAAIGRTPARTSRSSYGTGTSYTARDILNTISHAWIAIVVIAMLVCGTLWIFGIGKK